MNFSSSISLYWRLLASILIVAMAVQPMAFANPAAPVIRSGAAEFNFDNPAHLLIQQGSDKLIVDWGEFSISAGELTQFIQPGSGSAALNRVMGALPSSIQGQLQANGRVLLINPNGVLIGPGGRIDTAGFIASTLDVSDADFLAGGDLRFQGNSLAKVVNLGTINAIDGGDIFLIAREVVNAGTLNAPEGTVGLAAGQQIVIAAQGEERVAILPEGQEGSVTNSGTIAAATAELKAAGGNEYALAVNNTGLVRAKGFEKRGGRIYLSVGGGKGRIVNTGTLKARMEDNSGGLVQVTHAGEEAGAGVDIGGRVDVKGEVGSGGMVLVTAPGIHVLPGARIDASGQVNGGQIALHSAGDEGTMIDGALVANGKSGDGGFIHVTGSFIGLGANGEISANGGNGGGFVLLGADPEDGSGQVESSQIVLAPGSRISANGMRGDGGMVLINGARDSSVMLGGEISASSQSGVGGQVMAFGGDVSLGGTAMIDAGGYRGGGQVYIGGGQRGRDASKPNAQNTSVAEGALILANASAGGAGAGGRVILWADRLMDFQGSIENRGAGGGAGGFTEVSGLEYLGFNGTVDTGGGTLLLDPYSYIIGATEAGNIVTALISNNVIIDTTTDVTAYGSSGVNTDPGDITVNSAVLYDSTFDLTFLAMGDANFNASVQNSNDSGGDINIVAGWDGVTAYNTAAFVAEDVNSTSVFGAGNGSVNIGRGSQSTGVAVGSRSGTTNVFGYDVSLQGGNGGNGRFAQLGFQVSDQGAAYVVDGGITVHAKNNVSAKSGSGSRSYAQIGHVGADLSSDSIIEAAATSVIELSVGNDVIFAAGSGDLAYVQLGQGGRGTRGNHSGITTITQANDVIFTGGGDNRAYAQLGQGGYDARGNHSGITTIIYANDVIFTAGTGARAYAQLGQGGYDARGNHSGTTTITQANDVIFTARGGYAQLGQGGLDAGGNHSGTTIITQANDLVFTAGTVKFAYAQLGQGGSGAFGNQRGNTSLTLGGDLTLTGLNTVFNYARIGNGDFSGNDSGDVMIRAEGGVTLNKASIGNRVGSAKTYIGVVGDLNADATSVFRSGPSGAGGELRLYVGGNDNVDASSRLNGVAHGGTAFPNNQGDYAFGDGPYVAGFSYYSLAALYNYTVDTLAEATAIQTALNGGSDVTLTYNLNQANFGAEYDWDGGTQFIRFDSDLFYDSSNTLNLLATGDALFNASVQNRNATGGDINIVAGWDGITAYNTAAFVAEDVNSTTVFGGSMGTVNIGDGSQTSAVVVGSRSGNSNVFGYDVSLQGGNAGVVRFAQLGFQVSNQGASYVVDGDIVVHALNDVRATGGSGGTYNYVQIGHVGADRGFINSTVEATASSGIELSVGNNVSIESGDGVYAYAQLGQGGYYAVGDHSGTTTITQANDVSIASGDGLHAYAQLGQGGLIAFGNFSGDISLTLDGDLTIAGQNTSRRYALIGNGNGPQTFDDDTGRSVSGNVTVYVDGNTTVDNGWLGNLLDGEGVSNSGSMMLEAGGNITLDRLLNLGGYNSADVYSYIARGDVNFNASVQNRNDTGGDINIVAGWDGTTPYNTAGFVAEDVTSTTVFGVGMGSVNIGDGAQAAGVAVGSRSGNTNVFGYDVILQGGNSGDGNFAQLGFQVTDGMTQNGADLDMANVGGANVVVNGGIIVHALNDVRATGGNGANFNYVQIGHVGVDQGASNSTIEASASSVIELSVGNNMSFEAGGGNFSYAQLGQGGYNTAGAFSGTTTITRVNDISFAGGNGGGLVAYAQLGQGGYRASGNFTGTTTITRAADISFMGGNGNFAYAQLGQGGDGAIGAKSGDISVKHTGNLTLNGNGWPGGIGHGGSSGDVEGDVMIQTGGNASLVGAFIGHSPGSGDTYTSGNTFIGVVGDLIADAGSRFNSAPNNGSGDGELRFYVGGSDNVNTGTQLNGTPHGGTLFPNDQGDFVFGNGGYALPGASNPTPGNFNYYRIEQGIYNYAVDTLAEATAIQTDLNNGTDVTLVYNLNQVNFGAEYDWDGGTQFIRFDSALFYNSTNTLNLLATGDAIFNASVQNRNATGGDINIVAGWDGLTAYNTASFVAEDVTVTVAFGQNNGTIYIGNGGQALGVAVGSRSGTSNVFGYDVSLQAGMGAGVSGRFAQLGFQVSDQGAAYLVDGGITVHAVNDVSVTGGDTPDFNYAQIGHVGADQVADATIEATATSVIELSVGNDVRFMGGSGRSAYAQLGQGGIFANGSHSGMTTITQANNVSFLGGGGDTAYAQLGQGGSFADGDHSGTTLISQANLISFSAGGGVLAYAQLGQGGASSDGNHSGMTTISLANDVSFSGGAGGNAYAQLGQGGFDANGSYSGNTTIAQANDISFAGGGGIYAYAQLGQGGAFSDGSHSGITMITVANDVSFSGGAGNDAYVQLGQGGVLATGNHSGTTAISQANDISFSGGAGGESYAQLGQGGIVSNGNHSGSTTITQANDVSFLGGIGVDSYAQLGQGGAASSGDHSGNTTIAQANDVSFLGGAGARSYSQLGQGGYVAIGDYSGDISLTHAGDLLLTGGNVTDSYALIGHGDQPGDGDAGRAVSGDVMVRTGGNTTLTNAFIGHLIDGDGSYTSGDTFIGVGTVAGPERLIANANSGFFSAPTAQLRFYIPSSSSNQIAAGASLNGTLAPGPGIIPNNQGVYAFGLGPYNLVDPGNFAFYVPLQPVASVTAAADGDNLPGVMTLPAIGIGGGIGLSAASFPQDILFIRPVAFERDSWWQWPEYRIGGFVDFLPNHSMHTLGSFELEEEGE
ncbi:MAG: filamentous hemagglutinin N-terminal domain-containing protein [Verrucomicrobiota bacterium]